MKFAAVVLTVSLAVCGTAAAQAPATPQPAKPQPARTAAQRPKRPPRLTPRWFAGIDVGAQPGTGGFSDSLQAQRNAETQTTNTSYRRGTPVFASGSLAVQLHRAFGAGIAVSRFSRGGSAHVDASVPHPFFFNQLRQVAGDVPDVSRAETGVHVLLLYLPKPKKHLRLLFSGGPSYLNAEQELVSEVQYAETYPYDTATFTGARTERAKRSAIGFNVGADIIWMAGRRVGIGGLVRYTHGTVDLPTADSRPLVVTVGGAQAAGGLRIIF